MPVKLFLSYSHRDESHRERLNVHLATLKRQGSIVEWHDREIVPGQEWATLIDQNLASADIILLLVSANFVASDYCYGKELKLALEREQKKEAVVIPIILSPVDWKDAPFGYLQALPKDAKPITKWTNRDEAWMNAAQGIRAAVEAIESNFARSEPAPTVTKVTEARVLSVSEQDTEANELALATTLLEKPQSLAVSTMSKVYRGVHSRYGEVLLKILRGTTADSERWITSPAYRSAMRDRLFEIGKSETGLPFVLLRYLV